MRSKAANGAVFVPFLTQFVTSKVPLEGWAGSQLHLCSTHFKGINAVGQSLLLHLDDASALQNHESDLATLSLPMHVSPKIENRTGSLRKFASPRSGNLLFLDWLPQLGLESRFPFARKRGLGICLHHDPNRDHDTEKHDFTGNKTTLKRRAGKRGFHSPKI